MSIENRGEMPGSRFTSAPSSTAAKRERERERNCGFDRNLLPMRDSCVVVCVCGKREGGKSAARKRGREREAEIRKRR